MAETNVNSFTYAVVQFPSKKYENDFGYVAICSKWIMDIGRRKFFYWPKRSNSNCLTNKTAVRNNQDADSTTWMKVPIIQIVKYGDVFYEAVRCTVTLQYFNIDASTVLNFNEFYEKLFNHNCLNTIKIEEVAASFSSEDVIVSRSSMVSDRQQLSPSLLDRKGVKRVHSPNTSSAASTTTATTTTVSDNNPDRQDCEECSLSPSLLEKRSKRTSRCIRTVRTASDNNVTNNSSGDPSDEPTSPSLLASLFAVPRYMPYQK